MMKIKIKKGKSTIGARLSLKGALLKVGIQNLQGNEDGNGNGNGNGKGTSVSDFGREVSETNLLVATLITTVTFTAAFTVPGGYNQSGAKDEGLAVLSKSSAFGVFLIANTLAFGFSTTSVLIHFLLASDTSTEDVYHSEVIQRAPFFTNWSIGALLVAFISGTYTVVPHSFGISVAVILFCCFLGSMLFPSLNKEV
ncbi:protein ACCELERATED CELL DEATH 6-like [Quercus robur]|uniref:protein ACCELERATED CELL DEATH 6-like n=1 Tax=Quercus robur TaxID=38942 RepID=UPI002163B83C|nr:protein ACCELERATED CELL DEATH 6-like [Quercus robur]